jgi:uncharacterized membrane protein
MRPASLCLTGITAGTVFFGFSLTPSLVPRAPVVQGVVSGLSFAAGYALGVGTRQVWAYFELPAAGRRAQVVLRALVALGCGAVAAAFPWQAAEYQSALRMHMGMTPAGVSGAFTVAPVALGVFAALLALARAFHWSLRALARRMPAFVPRRVSHALGLVAMLALVWAVGNGVLFRYALRAADASFQGLDALIEDDVARPEDPLATGSAASRVAWSTLGRHGRAFVSSRPDPGHIAVVTGAPARAPIRVYVGLNSAPDPRARARLALRELQRVGAFSRRVLVLVTPTGAGWIDPGAMETLEFLHGGEVASVAVQYSYLPSALALLVESAYGAETARALFDEVYRYWKSLPPPLRPALYAYGLSLGALNSDRSFDLYDVMGDPPQGALWAGPPFRSETWRTVTARRNDGSPVWRPRFRNSTVVRFMTDARGPDPRGGAWGPLRILFLQHGSDPVTFFDPEIALRRPEWLRERRAPDVSAALRWFPLVTMLQVAADLTAGSAPPGFGHTYSAHEYLAAWTALTEPPGWTPEGLDRLRTWFAGR